jgi:hypothetical protein
MNALLDRQEPFVLVVNGVQEEESQEERKQRAIWFKRNRERLGRYCKGNIFLIEADSLRQQLQLRATKMSNSETFPFRVAIVATEAKALAQAQQLLIELKHS